MGFFSKIAQGLKKTKENISRKLYEETVGDYKNLIMDITRLGEDIDADI